MTGATTAARPQAGDPLAAARRRKTSVGFGDLAAPAALVAVTRYRLPSNRVIA
jgi:hypothetical protein